MKRRKASKSLLDNAPDVQLDSHLSSIASVRSAVEAACRDEGTTFNSLGNFDYNSFYVPLLAIAEQMKALMWAVDRWAFRAKVGRFSRKVIVGLLLILAFSICGTSTASFVSMP